MPDENAEHYAAQVVAAMKNAMRAALGPVLTRQAALEARIAALEAKSGKS